MSSNLPPMPFGTSEDLQDEGSGDFQNRSEEPAVLRRSDFEAAAVGDVHRYMAETHGLDYPRFLEELAEYGAERLIYWLVENGWEHRTVKDVGVLLGVLHSDGSWT